VWVNADVKPVESWQELEDRERISYLATDPAIQ
jgi:hypothetical protein